MHSFPGPSLVAATTKILKHTSLRAANEFRRSSIKNPIIIHHQSNIAVQGRHLSIARRKKPTNIKFPHPPTATPFKTVPAGTETKQNVKITFFFEKNEQFLEETNFWQECECKELE